MSRIQTDLRLKKFARLHVQKSLKVASLSSIAVAVAYALSLYYYVDHEIIITIVLFSIIITNVFRIFLSQCHAISDDVWFFRFRLLNLIVPFGFSVFSILAFMHHEHVQLVVTAYLILNALAASALLRLYLLKADLYIVVLVYMLSSAIGFFIWQNDVFFDVFGLFLVFIYTLFLFKLGSIQRHVFIDQKMTEFKLEDLIIDNELKKEEIIKNQKMSAVGELLSGIMHEINNPIAVVTTHTQLLDVLSRQSPKDEEKIDHSIKIIQKTASRLSKIISGTKALIRESTASEFESASVHQIIISTLDFLSEKMKNFNIQLTVEHLDEYKHLNIKCHPVQISQVLINLINNAFDALMKSVSVEKKLKINISIDQDNVIFTVIDNAGGLSEHVKSNLMKPFVTTKEKGLGSGLGLYISKKIIDAHGGQFYLKTSTVDQTEFVIKLPLLKNDIY